MIRMSKLIGIQHQISPALRRVGFPRYNFFQVSGTRMTLLELGDWMWISMKRMI
jgi:hypothetical protein